MFRCLLIPALAGCQGTSASEHAPDPGGDEAAIVARDRAGTVVSRVRPGHPCRATVESFDLQVGGPPLVAQLGDDRFTGELAANGLTLRKNDAPVARFYARQLFDHQGIPLVRVLESGDIADGASAIVRRATAATNTVTVGDFTVTGTSDLVLAAMLTAREASPEVRALIACHLVLPSEPNRKF